MSTSTPGTPRPTTTAKRSTRRKPASTRGATRTAPSTRRTTSRTTTTKQPKTRSAQAQVLAERAVLVPVGAGLLASDNLVSTVKGLAGKYRTRPALERELKRYERRGATARNRFERELRQRRSLVEKTMHQNRRRLNRELTSVRRDFEKQSGAVSTRVERLVANAQGLMGSQH